MNTTFQTICIWALRLIASGLLLQTLFFKFSGAPESIYIFTKLGMEPWGRIGTGVLELIASALILLPATTAFGALLATGLMSGAIFFHITKLGFVVQNDGGQLFIYCLLVLCSSLALVYLFRSQFTHLLKSKLHV
jgi:uncharacterized membrane protein YphA (DoxX/SURF4 family)